MAPLTALALAALVFSLVVERPADVSAPRHAAGLREALRSLPQPLHRAARELAGVRATESLALVQGIDVAPRLVDTGVAPVEGEVVVETARPREGLIDLPPPAMVI